MGGDGERHILTNKGRRVAFFAVRKGCRKKCFWRNGTIRALIRMIIGEKKGMTRIFREDGRSVPVTVVEASANRVTQSKTAETDGYSAVQVTRGSGNRKALNKG